MTESKYLIVQNQLKEKIQQGFYKVGDYLPSENELCSRYSITRTTVRKAMDELLKDGFIEKQHGKGSLVCERRKSLGLLAVKGFSEAVEKNFQTLFLQKPMVAEWSNEIVLPVNKMDLAEECIFFERLRLVENEPLMIEKNWFSGRVLPEFLNTEFTDGSFFKTLSRNFLIEIVGSEHELRSERASQTVASLLEIKKDDPVLHISIVFRTSNPGLNIYSELFCNTKKYPVGSSYSL
jgi:DNA-binding GntR family transcriptional regulator